MKQENLVNIDELFKPSKGTVLLSWFKLILIWLKIKPLINRMKLILYIIKRIYIFRLCATPNNK